MENTEQWKDLFYGYKKDENVVLLKQPTKKINVVRIIQKSMRAIVVFSLVGVATSVVYLVKFLIFIINFIF